jgi:ferredoxin
VDHSCREGVCASCETRVIAGEPDHRDSLLSAKERASNKVMMICVSGCKSPALALDL